jgi:hypothetical protein
VGILQSLFGSRRAPSARVNPPTHLPEVENVGGGNMASGSFANPAYVTGQGEADQFFPFASPDASIYDTGDLAGDISPGPQNWPNIPAPDWHDSIVDLTEGPVPDDPVHGWHPGVPVGLPYVAPEIMYVERAPSGVSGWWLGKMGYDASPNGIAHGQMDSDTDGPISGMWMPPIGQYVAPDQAQGLYLQEEWAGVNPNADVDVAPVLSNPWNS